jgi:rhodanese-related sulfurtransferase
MKAYFKNITLNKKLALVAVLLAVFAAVAGNPYKPYEKPSKTIEEIEVERNLVKFLDALLLAEWIMEKRDNFHLFDLRSKKEFDEYHIPHAFNLPQVSLKREMLQGKEKIVFYVQDKEFPHVAWKSFSEKSDAEILVLKGGLDKWREEVLFPDLVRIGVRDEKFAQMMKRTSLYFGGTPKIGKDPKKRLQKKYLREGC